MNTEYSKTYISLINTYNSRLLSGKFLRNELLFQNKSPELKILNLERYPKNQDLISIQKIIDNLDTYNAQIKQSWENERKKPEIMHQIEQLNNQSLFEQKNMLFILRINYIIIYKLLNKDIEEKYFFNETTGLKIKNPPRIPIIPDHIINEAISIAPNTKDKKMYEKLMEYMKFTSTINQQIKMKWEEKSEDFKQEDLIL